MWVSWFEKQTSYSNIHGWRELSSRPAIGLHNIPVNLGFTVGSDHFRGNREARDGNPVWVDIKMARIETSTIWLERVIRDFEGKAKPGSSKKTKFGAQESGEGLAHKLDLSLLYDWLMSEEPGKLRIKGLLKPVLVQKFEKMWFSGTFGGMSVTTASRQAGG